MAATETRGRLAPQGALTMATASTVHAQGRALAAQGDLLVDLSGVSEADSSALALLFDWMRVAAAAGHPVWLTGLPAGLDSLAELYGVRELLPGPPPSVSEPC